MPLPLRGWPVASSRAPIVSVGRWGHLSELVAAGAAKALGALVGLRAGISPGPLLCATRGSGLVQPGGDLVHVSV